MRIGAAHSLNSSTSVGWCIRVLSSRGNGLKVVEQGFGSRRLRMHWLPAELRQIMGWSMSAMREPLHECR